MYFESNCSHFTLTVPLINNPACAPVTVAFYAQCTFTPTFSNMQSKHKAQTKKIFCVCTLHATWKDELNEIFKRNSNLPCLLFTAVCAACTEMKVASIHDHLRWWYPVLTYKMVGKELFQTEHSVLTDTGKQFLYTKLNKLVFVVVVFIGHSDFLKWIGERKRGNRWPFPTLTVFW